jgi:hypothetical protein
LEAVRFWDWRRPSELLRRMEAGRWPGARHPLVYGMSITHLTASLPEELLSQMELSGADASWPLSVIPALIEACRAKGLINRGGDLRVIQSAGIWESPNIGVWVFESELSETAPLQRADEAARIALQKFFSLDAEALRSEVLAGCPSLLGNASAFDLKALRLSWDAQPANHSRCSKDRLCVVIRR